jgi:hypothetical protein
MRCTTAVVGAQGADRRKRTRLARGCSVGLLAAAITLLSPPTRADEGGVSFWVPGFFGSLAATPQVPGFSLATIYYHTTVNAGADVAFARQVPIGRLTVPFSANLSANLDAKADLVFAIPQYVFATPFLGGQAAVALIVPFGKNTVSVDATLTAALGPLGFTIGRERTDSVTGFGDLIPQFSVRWNHGVHNFMTYLTGDIPVGAYDAQRLANLGIGHGAIDAGGGYTYFNPQTGHEFSAVLGFTYNFENQSTQYQNGVDMHLDWGASQFLSKQVMAGLVGYVYKEIGCDSGSGDRVGCFQSQVLGIGPQIGFIFPMGDMQGYLNFKGYKEFAAQHRPEGWNVWATFVISPAPPTPSAPPRRVITK